MQIRDLTAAAAGEPTTSRCFIIALALIFASAAAVGLCCRGGKKTAQESNSSFGGFTC